MWSRRTAALWLPVALSGFWRWIRGRQRKRMNDEEASPKPQYDPETVDALVDEAKYHAQFEENRLAATNQRASWLLGFGGVILALAANQAREMLNQSQLLGPAGRPIAAVALLVGILLVVASIGLALSVIWRAKSWEWNREEIDDLANDDSVQRSRAVAQGTFLRGLLARILAERDGYSELRRRLTWAFATLAAGLAAIAVQIGVYAVRTIENPCPTGVTSSTQTGAPVSEARTFRLVSSTHVRYLTQNTTPTSPGKKSPFPKPGGGSCTR
jgi:hypothetical protein